MTTAREIALLRLVAQRVAGPGFATAAETVCWLSAAQAQDYAGALTSVALRTASGSRSAVEAALDAGAIVRSWPMRGTLHLVAAEDLRGCCDSWPRACSPAPPADTPSSAWMPQPVTVRAG